MGDKLTLAERAANYETLRHIEKVRNQLPESPAGQVIEVLRLAEQYGMPPAEVMPFAGGVEGVWPEYRREDFAPHFPVKIADDGADGD